MDRKINKELADAAALAGKRISDLLRRINDAVEYGPITGLAPKDILGDNPPGIERKGDWPYPDK